MVELTVISLIVGVAIAGILLAPKITRWRRNHLKRRPFPPLWEETIEKHLPFYAALFKDEQHQLQGNIQVLLAEKQFIGCGGLKVTLEMKLVIAAVSALLLLNQQNQYFSKLRSILLYPSTYTAQASQWVSPYVIEETTVARLGESWTTGNLVLSWAQVQRDMSHWQDGHNVILHEFSHQLDADENTVSGVPRLLNRAAYSTWAQVMTAEYQQLCQAVFKKQRTVLDSYGATNPAEFFAIATETFFEKPQSLHRQHPALYSLLQDYYQLDPRQWFHPPQHFPAQPSS
jgi:MtfA peptidase